MTKTVANELQSLLAGSRITKTVNGHGRTNNNIYLTGSHIRGGQQIWRCSNVLNCGDVDLGQVCVFKFRFCIYVFENSIRPGWPGQTDETSRG